VTVRRHVRPASTHLGGCVGFWLWALVGAGMVFGTISFVGVFLIPAAAVFAVLLARRSRWSSPVPAGLFAGAGVPLLVVAGLQWNAWHHRILGDNTPNPFYWGSVGLCLLAAGIGAYEVQRRHSR
jgi:hypothetical protein